MHQTAAPPGTPLSSERAALVVTNYPAEHFSTWQKLNPVWWLGNVNDPVAPEGYRRGKCCRNLTWYLRNPFHNFTFFVIGVADKPFTRVGRCPDEVFNPEGGWNWAVCRYKCLRLPFISYIRGGFKVYWGWRANGNFGIKLNFAGEKIAKPSPPP